jgi:hypothetical protein
LSRSGSSRRVSPAMLSRLIEKYTLISC